MLSSTATIATPRASRYREQLASHGAGMMRHTPDGAATHAPPVTGTQADGDTFVLSLAWGRCTITSDKDTLHLLAEAETAEDLARIQSGVGQRVAKIGRRDGLEVMWTESAGDSATNLRDAVPRGRRGVFALTAIGGLVVVMVLVHVGVAASLVGQQWTWWMLAVIAVVVAAKLLLTRHFAIARRMHGRRRSRRV